MPDNKKYYYLKLKEGFFESDELKILQSMPRQWCNLYDGNSEFYRSKFYGGRQKEGL